MLFDWEFRIALQSNASFECSTEEAHGTLTECCAARCIMQTNWGDKTFLALFFGVFGRVVCTMGRRECWMSRGGRRPQPGVPMQA